MEYPLNIARQTRENFINLIETSTVEELNIIPEGFNNNIIWNFAHIMASQQGLCYLNANAEPVIESKYVAPFRKGTKPERFIDTEEITTIKELMRSTIDQLEQDLKSDKFQSYNGFVTHYGVEIKNAVEAAQFFIIHDALHFGIASTMLRLIRHNENKPALSKY